MDCSDKKILIIKQSSLGDIIHTLPLVHALKRTYPSCTIGWVAQKTFAPLLACDPSVDTVHAINIPSTSEPGSSKFVWLWAAVSTWSVLKELRRECRQQPYDIVLDLHASFRSGLLGRSNPGGTRIGFQNAKELNTLFQNRLIEVDEHIEHALDKNLLFCDHLGCSVAPADFSMSTGSAEDEAVRALLETQGINANQVVIYANPCARWQTKFWLPEYWAVLADRIAAQGKALIFAGSSADRKFIARISSRMQSKPYIAAGELGVTGAVALLKRSAAYVGLDSGPMHMAAMTKTPVVALFGPTHPERVGPYGVEHVIVRNEKLECLGCRKRQCDHLSCMQGISVDEVFNALVSLLPARP